MRSCIDTWPVQVVQLLHPDGDVQAWESQERRRPTLQATSVDMTGHVGHALPTGGMAVYGAGGDERNASQSLGYNRDGLLKRATPCQAAVYKLRAGRGIDSDSGHIIHCVLKPLRHVWSGW